MRNSSCCAHALKQPEVRVEEAQLLIVRGSGGLVANLDLIEVENYKTSARAVLAEPLLPLSSAGARAVSERGRAWVRGGHGLVGAGRGTVGGGEGERK